MPTIVHELGEELGAAACDLDLGVFGRAVLPRPPRMGDRVRAVAWRWERRSRIGVGRVRGRASVLVEGPPSLTVGAEALPREHVRDGRQAVGRLVRRDVVDVRGVREVRVLVGDVARQRVRLVPSCEGLVEGGGLDDPLVRKLLVGRGHDAESRRRFPPGSARRLWWEASQLSLLSTLHGGIAWPRRLL